MTEDERRAAMTALEYAARILYYGWGNPLARREPPKGSAAESIGIKAVSVGTVLSDLAAQIGNGENVESIWGSFQDELQSRKENEASGFYD